MTGLPSLPAPLISKVQRGKTQQKLEKCSPISQRALLSRQTRKERYFQMQISWLGPLSRRLPGPAVRRPAHPAAGQHGALRLGDAAEPASLSTSHVGPALHRASARRCRRRASGLGPRPRHRPLGQEGRQQRAVGEGWGVSLSQVPAGVPSGRAEGTRCRGLCTRSTDTSFTLPGSR